MMLAVTPAKWRVDAMGSGTVLPCSAPVPSCPNGFASQQWITPVVATPHVANAPTLSVVIGGARGTRTGSGSLFVYSRPSCRYIHTAPQQYVALATVRAHVRPSPALMLPTRSSKATRSGIRCGTCEPMPNWPRLFAPQQYAKPSARMAQVWPSPAPTVVTAPMGTRMSDGPLD